MKEEKCVLVINKPYSCACCMCRGGDDCFAIEDIEMKDKFHDWYRNINRQPAPGAITWENCPLKPLPQMREPNEEWLNEYHRDEFADGWNACLKEIIGAYITQEEADLCGVQLWHDD